MNFRNALLTFSMFVIGLTLILYYQSEPEVQSMSYDQFRTLHYNQSRSHSLIEFNEKIIPLRLEDLISEAYEKNRLARKKTRVMEIGFGNGRVLMELKKRFPFVEFYGINKEKTLTFYRRESFALAALKFNIMTKDDLENMELPFVLFQDIDFGQKIPYDNEKFDIIFSQNTIPFIRYKFELFDEILRLLKIDGVSIHTEVSGLNFFQNGLILSLKEVTKELRKKGLEIYVLDNNHSIRFKKKSATNAFSLVPHSPIPHNLESLPNELRRPEMSYNLN